MYNFFKNILRMSDCTKEDHREEAESIRRVAIFGVCIATMASLVRRLIDKHSSMIFLYNFDIFYTILYNYTLLRYPQCQFRSLLSISKGLACKWRANCTFARSVPATLCKKYFINILFIKFINMFKTISIENNIYKYINSVAEKSLNFLLI